MTDQLTQIPPIPATPPVIDATASFPSAPEPGKAGTPTRPAWLPEKFKSPEDMAKSYQELERRLGSQGNQQPQNGHAPAPQTFAPPAPAAPAQTPQGGIPEPAPVSDWKTGIAPYAQTWARDGRLSEAQYQELGSRGYEREIVDTFFAGLRAQSQLTVNLAQSRVGGAQNYAAMIAWAGTNLTASERQRFNAAIGGGDQELAAFAVDAVHSRWRAAGGAMPTHQVLGDGSAPTGLQPYANLNEYYAEMRKPEWADPAYQARCDQRASISPFMSTFQERLTLKGQG